MNCDTLEHPRDGSPMVLVPAGVFTMGAADNNFLAEEHEKPARQVALKAFWIDAFPATNKRFALFVSDGGYENPEWWCEEGWAWRSKTGVLKPAQWNVPGWDGDEQPVAGVSWYEADAYAHWAGRRLPTDAEWEKAARGTDGRHYPWGNDWPSPDLANFNLHVGRTTPVGLYPKGVSPYGCFDMAGNVNNWVADWYWPRFGRFCVETSLLENPRLDDQLRCRLEEKAIEDKVDRGGGFATPRELQEVLSCTRKVHWAPIMREPWNGFRTVMDVSSGSEQTKGAEAK
jgi:formylglycine-generating enzyme required for sulfatase activity